MRLCVAGAQLPVTRDVAENVAAIGRAIDYARGVGAEILLTPEGSLSGYTPSFDVARVRAALEEVRGKACQAGIGLALGTCFIEPDDGLCYNEIRFYTPEGDYLGFHNKTLRCATMTDPPVGELNDYSARPLRVFDFRGICIGGLICNDLWANPGCTPMPDPHLTQQLAAMGARIIFHAVNGGRDGSEWSGVNWRFHEANLQMRAAAGKLWIVTADCATPVHLPCSAPSGVIAPSGEWVCRADPVGEQYFHYTIDLTEE